MIPTIIVHGGAGSWSDNRDVSKTEFMLESARVGYEILKNGDSALDAVEKAVNVLEDAHPLIRVAEAISIMKVWFNQLQSILLWGQDVHQL